MERESDLSNKSDWRVHAVTPDPSNHDPGHVKGFKLVELRGFFI